MQASLPFHLHVGPGDRTQVSGLAQATHLSAELSGWTLGCCLVYFGEKQILGQGSVDRSIRTLGTVVKMVLTAYFKKFKIMLYL